MTDRELIATELVNVLMMIENIEFEDEYIFTKNTINKIESAINGRLLAMFGYVPKEKKDNG